VNFVDNPEALQRWRDVGADVKGERVRIPRGLARKLCATAPSRIVQHARNPELYAKGWLLPIRVIYFFHPYSLALLHLLSVEIPTIKFFPPIIPILLVFDKALIAHNNIISVVFFISSVLPPTFPCLIAFTVKFLAFYYGSKTAIAVSLFKFLYTSSYGL